jgi:hypothetical protein
LRSKKSWNTTAPQLKIRVFCCRNFKKEVRGKILEYAWKLRKRGLAPSTIKGRIYKLRKLAREGAELMNPDSISTVLALSNWTESYKKAHITTYKSFTKTFNLNWTPPKTRVQRKLPFIPTEKEID